MRILLTGTSGQVGGALLPLLRRSQEVLAPNRAEFDLSDPRALAAALDRLEVDLIINPAAYTAVDRAEDEPELALRINAEAPAELACWAARHSVPLVHFSTDYVFDGSGETPWREEHRCCPLSSYGRSKWAGEKAIQASGAPQLIIRTSWVYAAQGTNFLRTVNRLARERDELRVVADQFGAPTSASAIAEAVAMICTQRFSCRARQGFRGGTRAHPCRQLRQHKLAWFCERNRRGIKGEGTACEGPRGSRDHDKGFSDQGRTPGQFAA
jgi:dTDP-4-dehydrorhamnose reductase